MAVDLNATRINPHDPQIEPMLRNLQGNILKGHGRNLVTILFTSFHGSPDIVRGGLATVAARVVTSALVQRDQTEAFHASRISGGLFGNILLSSNGYRKLGFTDDQIRQAFPERQGDFGELSNFFEGMQAHGDELNDPAPSGWEAGYRDGTIDAMFLLADDDKPALQAAETQLRAELAGFANVLAAEHGNALRTPKGEGFENFGFLDGRSQPIYFAPDLAREGPIDTWDPSEPLARVLVADGNAGDPDAFGSFLVFRKLEQDVLGFKTRVEAVADALGLVGNDRGRAGAMAVGRFEDGTPVILSPTAQAQSPPANNFRNDADPQGLQCPFHAHTRKTNPRGDIVRQFGAPEDSAERAHRITRRGIPYGTRANDMSDRPSKGVGLLFMCFQASISNQFTFMQRSWANKEDFLVGGTGADPVIGQRSAAGGDPPVIQQWPTQWGQAGTQGVPFGQFVTLKGGEFFFAPSLPFFKNLATPPGGSA